MRHLPYLGFIVLFSIFTACKGDGSGEGLSLSDSLGVDSLLIDSTLNPIDTVQVDSAGYIDETLALTSQIEKIYGEQWDFCDCVIKNDSIEKAIFATDDEAQLDLILERMIVVDQHCKELLTTPNTTPDDRAKHERKVNRCLRNAK